MPTKKKRVGFIPREDVMKIIDELSIENNLSNSKIIGILVEEALSMRGIFNKKIGKVTQSFQLYNDKFQHLPDNSNEFINNDKLAINTKLVNNDKHTSSTNIKDVNQEAFDLHTYKKFLSFLKFQEMMDKYNT